MALKLNILKIIENVKFLGGLFFLFRNGLMLFLDFKNVNYS